MKATKFTGPKVDGFKYNHTGSRIQREWDVTAPGLGVEMFKGGSKSWIFRYRIFGKQKFMTLGAVNDFKLADVQASVATMRAILTKGEDPKAAADLPSQDNTLDEGYHAYINRKVFEQKSPDFQNNFKSTYRMHLQPTLGARPVGSIKRRDLLKVINTLIGQDKTGAAKGVLTRSRILFKFLVQEYDLDNSPTYALEPEFPKSDKAMIVLLHADQLKKAWFFDGRPQLRALVRMLLLTGARRDEMRMLRWSHIEDGVIRIPKTKNGKPLVLPVTNLMREVLSEMKKTFDSDYVFPASGSVNKPIPKGSVHYLLAKHAEFQSHALRRTVKTWLSKLNVNLEGRNAVCNHSHGGMDALYNYDHDQLDTKRAALDVWHAKLAEIMTPTLKIAKRA